MHTGEPLRRDADDGELDRVEAQGAADDVALPAVFALPHAVADDDNRTAAGHAIVLRGERAAEERPHPERGEELAVHEDAERDARLLVRGLREAERRVRHRRQARERLRPLPDFVDVRVGEAADRIALRGTRSGASPGRCRARAAGAA